MEILSTNKPEVEKKPEPKIEYNNRSYQSYIDTGFADNIPNNITAPRDRLLRFINKCDIRKGPIERTVRSIVRLRAPDFNTKKHELKEFIYYEEDWDGVNWLGVPIFNPISGHIEGKYTEVVTRPKLDERTGEHIDNVFGGTREVYYIPFNQKNVDEIIANSARSDKTGIRYIVKFSNAEGPSDILSPSTRNQFSYQMFLWPWDKLHEFQYWPVDDLFNRPKPIASTKTAKNLEFKPS